MQIVPDEDDPYARLTCTDERTGEVLYEGKVAANFRLGQAAVERLIR
jgi:hypothetical protein